ncbi:hypothetical protein COP1_036476 [Malus domestica]
MVASSGSAVPTGIPSSPLFSYVINGVCELNKDRFQSFTDGMPYLQAHIDGMISYLVKAVTDLDSGLGSNQSLGFEEPHTGGSFPPHPSQSSGQGEFGRCKTETVLTSEKRKRWSLCEARGNKTALNSVGGNGHWFGGGGGSAEIMNSLSMEREKPLERELLLFKDSENCLSGSGIASNAKEESQTDLHLLLQL